MALIPVPDGHLGTVVTYLEMTARPLPRPVDARHLRLKRWPSPEPAKYRRLFRRVGTRWLWYSRLLMDDARLAAELGEVHAVIDPAGIEVGMLELDFRTEGECLTR